MEFYGWVIKSEKKIGAGLTGLGVAGILVQLDLLA